jgi:AcrR family transcriptional regulator
MPRKRREDVIELTREKILDAARQNMAKHGSAGLSLREIARSIDMTAPAIYYYFASLDELITALILDAFNAMADALEVARDKKLSEGGTAAQALFEVCLTYRTWAIEHQTDFELIYGTPIPDYDAPSEITTPAAARSGDVFGKLIYMALQSGIFHPLPPYDVVPPAIADHLRELYNAPALDTEIMLSNYLTAVGWPQLHGIIMLEIFGHIGPFVGDVAAFYQQQVINMMKAIGFTEPF